MMSYEITRDSPYFTQKRMLFRGLDLRKEWTGGRRRCPTHLSREDEDKFDYYEVVFEPDDAPPLGLRTEKSHFPVARLIGLRYYTAIPTGEVVKLMVDD